jgi:hypothetical protein
METLTMAKSIYHASTKADGWEIQCCDWAKARLLFELSDVESPHFAFFQYLTIAFGYRYEYESNRSPSLARFSPKEEDI